MVTLKVMVGPPAAAARTPSEPSGPRASGRIGFGPALAGDARAVAAEGEGDRARDDAALREGDGQRAAHHAALGEGDAAREEAGEPAAERVGERLEGGLERDLGEAQRQRAQDVAEAFALEGDVDEGAGERGAELAAELGRLVELLLELVWCRR